MWGASVTGATQSPEVPVLYAVTDPVTALAFLRGQLASLRADGFRPHLACASSPELEAFAAAEGVVTHDVPLTRRWWGRGDFASLFRAIRVLRRVRPAVLNYSTPKAALVWAVACWFARPAFVVFLLRGLRVEGQRRWRPGFAVLWLMEWLAARTADVTVCVSPSLRRRALQLGLLRPDRSVVLGAGSSNGVDLDRFHPVSADERVRARERLGLAETVFVVGFVGRLAKDKGISTLIDALEARASTGELSCLMVGPTEPGYDLDAELATRPAAARVVHRLPATPRVEEVYAGMDVLVLPSLREGMSNVLLEAQARGLPCITTDGTGCADAVEPDVSGLVVRAGAQTDLAAAIAALAEDPGRRQRMGAAGRDRVERLFGSEQVWPRYAELYRHGTTSREPPTVQREQTTP